ncbi:hypothetical protein PoB_000321700 [Plakobranchus ocellatus]|uniref:Transposase n=1 Tax=Plakobranchus ocellatus TaxID=259542 RepID=A0AAV3Y1W3_9GAST|nr:hypothetical protein PoB_000321700 [Plakobranchus ocellatus]
MVKKRSQSSVIIAKTKRFLGADVGNDHNLVIMSISFRLTKKSKDRSIKIRFNIENLNDPRYWMSSNNNRWKFCTVPRVESEVTENKERL